MSDTQISSSLVALFVLSAAAATAYWLILSLRRSPRVRTLGWTAIAAVVAAAAAVWKLREGGEAADVLIAGGLGLVAAYIALAGAGARVKMTQAMLDPSKRAGSRLSKRKPKDFSEV
jgi:hypothetical protein